MKRTWIIILGFLALISCHNTSQQNCTEPSKVRIWKNGQWATDWMQKYAEYVRGNDRFFTDSRIIDIWNTWGLAYIDDDATPVMVLFCPGEAYGNKVLTIHDGKVTEWNSWRCNASYIPKSGLIENKDGSMGEYWDKVFLLKDGVFTEIFNHTDKLFMSHDKMDDSTVTNEYYCHLGSDSTLRIGFEAECKEHHDQKDRLYTSVGDIVGLCSIEHFPTSLFEEGWTQDSVSAEEYTISLTVK